MAKIERYYRIIFCIPFRFVGIHEINSLLITLVGNIQRTSIIRQRSDKWFISIKIHCTDNRKIDSICIHFSRFFRRDRRFKFAIAIGGYVTFIVCSVANILQRKPYTVSGIHHKNSNFIIAAPVRIYGTAYGSPFCADLALYSQCRTSVGRSGRLRFVVIAASSP